MHGYDCVVDYNTYNGSIVVIKDKDGNRSHNCVHIETGLVQPVLVPKTQRTATSLLRNLAETYRYSLPDPDQMTTHGIQ